MKTLSLYICESCATTFADGWLMGPPRSATRDELKKSEPGFADFEIEDHLRRATHRFCSVCKRVKTFQHWEVVAEHVD